ncbi:cobalt-zinc-cadmium resistance protein [Paucibacter sp. JuS9]|uniref:cobalt-zinc-cadmium resistance protein n=1 Tax=Roseateles TaxID=93681 RepID=UPI002FE6A70A
MRRCIVFLFALLVLLQFSWATAASYCGHEDSAPKHRTHFGHHAHSHEGDVNTGESAGKSSAKSVLQAADLDHGHCHLNQLALAYGEGLLLPPQERSAPPTDLPCVGESFVPEGLDRPNWLRA